MPIDDALFNAFREDHAVLGRGFHDLSQSLRASDMGTAQRVARHLDEEAGAHIAFEERYFYPALVPLIGANEVERLMQEHGRGLGAIREILAIPDGETVQESQWVALLQWSQEMEQHIAECGELFGAMGRIAEKEREALHKHLLKLRRESPRWTDLAADEAPKATC